MATPTHNIHKLQRLLPVFGVSVVGTWFVVTVAQAVAVLSGLYVILRVIG